VSAARPPNSSARFMLPTRIRGVRHCRGANVADINCKENFGPLRSPIFYRAAVLGVGGAAGLGWMWGWGSLKFCRSMNWPGK
jgi:hypothetical protein